MSAVVARPARSQAAAPQLKAGFVYVGPVGKAGWTYQHELGRQALERDLKAYVGTRYVEAAAEGADGARALRELARSGHQLIFATSPRLAASAVQVAAEFPNVRFELVGGLPKAPNLKTYNVRSYEGRYLAGMLAAQASRSGVVGYVASFPVPAVIQGLNAFALGLRERNPKATVHVQWVNAWDDPTKEREAALKLVQEGADVLTHDAGSLAVPQVAEERRVKLLAYQSDLSAWAPKAQIAAVTHHWDGYYNRSARSVLSGTWTTDPVWDGLREGLVRLTAVSAALPKAVLDAVMARRVALMDSRFRPFEGLLLDNTGRQRQAAEATMADAQIASMDWLVQGVVGRPPAR